MDYLKVGRGGAGNYYGPQDIKIAEKPSAEDLERQSSATEVNAADVERNRAAYAHSGRGGAGNYTDADKLVKTTAASANVTPALRETKPPKVGHYGRGGAGNYRDKGENASHQEGTMANSEAREKVHQEVVKVVESSLKEPEKAHLGG